MVAPNLSNVMDRILDPLRTDPSVAHWILQRLRFTAEDEARMNELSDKARAGTLTPDEDRELEEYCDTGDILTILRAKAGQAQEPRVS